MGGSVTLPTTWKLLGKNLVINSEQLPAGYTHLEYINFSDGAYIQTPYKPNNNTRVICDFYTTEFGSPNALFGARDSTAEKNFNLWIQADLFGAQFNGNDWTSNQKSINLNARKFHVDFNRNTCKIDDVSATFTNGTFQCSYPLTICAVNTANTIDPRRQSGRLYWFQIYDSNALKYNFIAAKNSSNVAGLYDLNNNIFYTNNGTGSITAGPAI